MLPVTCTKKYRFYLQALLLDFPLHHLHCICMNVQVVSETKIRGLHILSRFQFAVYNTASLVFMYCMSENDEKGKTESTESHLITERFEKMQVNQCL